MSFDTVIGQKRPKKILTGALRRDTLASSYLFFGPRGVGKLAMALELAKSANCLGAGSRPCDQCSTCRRIMELKHPDVSIIFPRPKKIKDEDLADALESLASNLYHMPDFTENAEIRIEDMRRVRSEASYRPYEGRKKVFILAQADKLNIHAANALLKTLEEPPAHVLIILTTDKPGKLPSTILSRCQQIRFALLSDAEIAQSLERTSTADPDELRLVSHLAQGSLNRARELLQKDVRERRAATLHLLGTALSGNLSSVIKVAGQMGRWRQRSLSEEYLETIQILYRDLMLLLEDDEKHLVNEDLKTRLAKIARLYDWQGVRGCFRVIQQARRAISANVNLELLWIVLFIRLRRQRRS